MVASIHSSQVGTVRHAVQITVLGLSGITVEAKNANDLKSLKDDSQVSAIVSFSRNDNVATTLPSKPLFPYVGSRDAENDVFVYKALWEYDQISDPDRAVVTLTTRLNKPAAHVSGGATVEESAQASIAGKSYEVTVGLVRGAETIVLGASQLDVNEHSMSGTLDLFMKDTQGGIDIKESMHSKSSGASQEGDPAKHKQRKWFGKKKGTPAEKPYRQRITASFVGDKRWYSFSDSASLRVHLDVLPTQEYEARRRRRNNETESYLNSQAPSVVQESRLATNVNTPKTSNGTPQMNSFASPISPYPTVPLSVGGSVRNPASFGMSPRLDSGNFVVGNTNIPTNHQKLVDIPPNHQKLVDIPPNHQKLVEFDIKDMSPPKRKGRGRRGFRGGMDDASTFANSTVASDRKRMHNLEETFAQLWDEDTMATKSVAQGLPPNTPFSGKRQNTNPPSWRKAKRMPEIEDLSQYSSYESSASQTVENTVADSYDNDTVGTATLASLDRADRARQGQQNDGTNNFDGHDSYHQQGEQNRASFEDETVYTLDYRDDLPACCGSFLGFSRLSR